MNVKPLVDVLEMPPVEWEGFADSLTIADRGELSKELADLTARAAMLSSYFDMRYGCGCGDQSHGDAVKECNKIRAKVRKVLGYAKTHAITF